MAAFNIKLTEQDRAKLEAHRIALGLRSHAEVIRHWISAPVSKVKAGEPLAFVIESPGRETKRFEGRSVGGKPGSSGLSIPVGPAPEAPGSRLKKPKR